MAVVYLTSLQTASVTFAHHKMTIWYTTAILFHVKVQCQEGKMKSSVFCFQIEEGYAAETSLK